MVDVVDEVVLIVEVVALAELDWVGIKVGSRFVDVEFTDGVVLAVDVDEQVVEVNADKDDEVLLPFSMSSYRWRKNSIL